MVRYSASRELPNAMNDLPNFKSWTNENLAQFAEDSYLKMQEQQETIEQLRQNWKDAMVQVRRLMKETND